MTIPITNSTPAPDYHLPIINFLTLHGLSQSAAEDCLAQIEDGECPELTLTSLLGRGAHNTNKKYDTKTIRQVCQMLQDKPHLSCVTIGRINRVGVSTVENVYRGRTWTHISRHYDFSSRRRNFNRGEEG